MVTLLDQRHSYSATDTTIEPVMTANLVTTEKSTTLCRRTTNLKKRKLNKPKKLKSFVKEERDDDDDDASTLVSTVGGSFGKLKSTEKKRTRDEDKG